MMIKTTSAKLLLTPEQVHKDLEARASEKLREFSSGLMPTVNKEQMLGVPVPEVRKLARQYLKSYTLDKYLAELPHRYWEELLLHGELLNLYSDFETALERVETLLPYINDWASCDTLSLKAFAKNRQLLLFQCSQWLERQHEYTVRFGLVCLKQYYLDELFSREILALAASVRREEYYIRMAQAWFFAEALLKQPDATLPFLTEGRLLAWVHNKSIQKACESKRVPLEFKTMLRTLRVPSR